MTSWLSSTFLDTLDTLGFGPGSSQPKPQKCKHSEDEHGRTKVRRQGEAASLKAQRQSESAYPKTPTKKRDSGVVVDKPSELNVAESDGGDKPRRTSRENTLPIQTEALEPQFMDEAIETDANPPIASPPDVQPFLAKSSRVFTKSQAPMNKANTLSKPVSPKAKTVTLDPVIGYDTDWKQGIATEQEWAMRPDKRALELALGSKNPKRSIMHEVQEPEYVLRDTEIRDGLWQLMDSMERLDEEFLDYGTGFKFRMPTSFFEKFSAETVKVISRVASGGPGGVQGWHDLFLDNHNRRALSMAIIGNVLVEQVFQHLFFGGSVRHVQKLTMLQAEYRHEDGFDRNKHYATTLRSILTTNSTPTSLTLPPNFANHINYLVGVIYTHLKPILDLHHSHTTSTAIIPSLHSLVTQAGLLSLSMRLDPHTIYYFPPLHKEDVYSSQFMDCANKSQMQQTHPRTPDAAPQLSKIEQQRRARIPAAEKERAKNDEPMVQIVVFNGVTAYRMGGWESATSTADKVDYVRSEYERMGIRHRVLTHGRVYCRWGRGPGVKDPKLHGEAWKGGFWRFSEVEGVVDWFGAETAASKGKGKEKEVYDESIVSTSSGDEEVSEEDLQDELNELDELRDDSV